MEGIHIFTQKKLKSILVFMILAWTFCPGFVPSAKASVDTEKHWAEPVIDRWVKDGMINGYDDGSFQPDRSITRAEIAALINRKFKLASTKETLSFPDLPSSKWQFGPLATAVGAGYIKGYEDGTIRPDEAVTRQELAVIIARLSQLEAKEDAAFADRDKFPVWSKTEIAAVAANGIMDGYGDATFAPNRAVTRAEAVVTLDRSSQVQKQLGPLVFSTAGVIGPESGSETWSRDVTVNAQGITLRNITISGNLLLGEGIGEGDVTLQNVTVTGTTTVKGGGPNSIHFENSTLAVIVIEKANGEVRIVGQGNTSVQEMEVRSAVKIEEENMNGTGFTRVVLPENLPEGTEVKLLGDFQRVQINSKGAKVQIIQGTVDQLEVAQTAVGSVVSLDKQVTVKDFVVNAVIQVSGQGNIEKATVSDGASATTFENTPSTLNAQATAIIGGGGGGGSSTTTQTSTQPGSPTNLTIQASVIGYNKLGLAFSESVDSSSINISLKNSSIEVDRVEYASDSRSATVILKAALTEGSHTIVVQQSLSSGVRTVEQDITVENERVIFSYLHDSVNWDPSSPAYIKVKYQLINQYGEDITSRYSSEMKFSFFPDVRTSNHEAPDHGTVTLHSNRSLNENERIVIYAFRGTSNLLKKEMIVSREEIPSTSPGVAFVTSSFEIEAEAIFVIGDKLITKYAASGNFANASWTLNGSVSQAVYQAQYTSSEQDIAVFTIQGGSVPSGLHTATPAGSSTAYNTVTVGTVSVNGAVYGQVYNNSGKDLTTVINATYLNPNTPFHSKPLAVNDTIRVFYGNELQLKAAWNGNAWSFNEIVKEPVTAPLNVTAAAESNRQIRISWSPVENADYYKIYSSSAETGAYTPLLDVHGNVIKTKETTVLDEGLQPNTKRYYFIKAALGGVNWEVESNASATVTATTYYNEHIRLDFQVADSVQHPTEPILYMTDKENLKLHAVNYVTGKINSVTLPLPPESVTFADGKIYIALLKGAHSSYWWEENQGGAVAIVNAADLTLSETFDVNIDPFDIAVDRSGYIYIASGSGQWTHMKSYSPAAFGEVASTDIRQASYIQMHPSLNRIYTITTDTSPRDISAYNIQNGTFSSASYDSPYHGDYSMSTQMRISPDGTYLFNGAGTVFEASEARSSDMKYVYSLNTGFTDIVFDTDENRFYTAKDKLIGAYQYEDFKQIGKFPADGTVQSLYRSSDKLFTISKIGSRSVVEIVYKSDMQSLEPVTVGDGVYLHGTISDIVNAPDGQKAYALDEAFHKLYVIDLVNSKIERTVSLSYKPSEAAISEDGTKLYIRNNDASVLVTELSLSDFQTQRHLTYQAPSDYSDPAHGQIYQRGQYLYVVTGEWSPRLLVFNASSFEKINYGAEIQSVGDIAFSSDNSKLYYWFQYGWDAGLAGTDVYEISIASLPYTQTSRSNIGYPDFKRDPLDTPLLILEDRGLVIAKNRVLNKDQLDQTVAVLPEPIYAVSMDGKTLAGKNGLYDAQTYQKLQSISLSGARYIFFANNKLYYLDGSTLKQLP